MSIRIEKDRKWVLAGLLLGIISFGLLAVNASVKAGLVFALFFWMIGIIKIKYESSSKRMLLAVLILNSVLVFLLSQLLLNQGVSHITVFKRSLGILLVWGFFLLVYGVVKNLRCTLVFGFSLLMILAAADYIVFSLRGSELSIMDIFSVKAALTVAKEYTLNFSSPAIYAMTATGGYLFFLFHAQILQKNGFKRITGFISGIGIMLLVLIIGTKYTVVTHSAMAGTMYNGYFLNFYLGISDSIIIPPKGYSSSEIAQIDSEYSNSPASGQEVDQEELPDVIVIMDESFADLKVFGDFDTDIPITPFLDSLSENVIRGYALSSVYGGQTPNSEWEFLTGNSMAFLPSTSVPYQQYINSGEYSILRYLQDLGYTCTGTHSNIAKSYQRDIAYEKLGFNQTVFIDEYPQEKYIRNYLSDEETFDEVLKLYHQDTDGHNFIFAVTMQNHGPYDYDGDDFIPTVHLNNVPHAFPKAEQYLSLIHETDLQMERLIDHLSQQDKKTVVVFFGDHQPNLDRGFITSTCENELSELEERELQYVVPFIIWANYDIEEKQVPLTSLNYLHLFLYDVMGIPVPGYSEFLLDCEDIIPAMNAFGYFSNADGSIKTLDQAEAIELELIKRYRYLQYNEMFDTGKSNLFR